jgi:uncharacterized membrane protein
MSREASIDPLALPLKSDPAPPTSRCNVKAPSVVPAANRQSKAGDLGEAAMTQTVAGDEIAGNPATVAEGAAAVRSAAPGGGKVGRLRGAVVCLLLAALALRSGFIWADTFVGASLPRVGAMGYTAIFAGFSILHAADMLGWRRALVFLGSCVAVCWCFEAVGLATGLIYGPYHYSAALGVKIAGVPALIPFAWFMMVYASWIVTHVLLEGAQDPASLAGAVARSVVAAGVMTAWDVVMDPGNARAGTWVWENGGAYFGVPFQNFVGWMVTTLVVYLVVALIFRWVPGRETPVAARFYGGLPVIAYGLVALDHLLVASLPELHVVAAFGIGLIALLALLRVILVRGPVTLPG